MKIAVLHWYTQSVGGISTTLEAYRAVAEKRGDTFHVLYADVQKSKKPGLLPERKRIAGGDSFIYIDGYAPHAPNVADDSAAFVAANYDVVLLSYLCPHQTKRYGDEPVFMQLIRKLYDLGVPIIGYIHDAYWETYEDWGKLVLPYTEKTLVAQKAYGDPLKKLGYPVTPVYLPFFPHTELHPRAFKRYYKQVLWTPQWKAIKGIYGFLKGVPALLDSGHSVDMYNNGIEYYKWRLTQEYRELISDDYFTGEILHHDVRASFYGCVPLPEIERALQHAGFMCDFQGVKAKYKAYLNGSYNHTVLEAMYYGAVPVVHENMLKTGIHPALLCPVQRVEDYPATIAAYDARGYPRKAAREYVQDNFDAERLYAKIFLGIK